MKYPLSLLIQTADGFAKQFGSNCEILVHDLTSGDLDHTIVYIVNGHVTNRKVGDGPSRVVIDTLEAIKKHPESLKDHLGYLTKTSNGKILKSSTLFIRDEKGEISYLLSINFDITSMIAFQEYLKPFVEAEDPSADTQPEPIITNVNDLLDNLLDQSVALVGKPAALMNKDEKVTAIRFLNDAGAFLITKSGDKISKYFGISKYTLYSYIDVKNHKAD